MVKASECTTICTDKRRCFREISVAIGCIAVVVLFKFRSRVNLERMASSIASRLSVIMLRRHFFTSVSQRPRDKRHEIEISRHSSAAPLISGIPRFTVSESFHSTPHADRSLTFLFYFNLRPNNSVSWRLLPFRGRLGRKLKERMQTSKLRFFNFNYLYVRKILMFRCRKILPTDEESIHKYEVEKRQKQ